MKKRQTNRGINRNTIFSNEYRRNKINPSIFTDRPAWLDRPNESTGIEIIELKSGSSSSEKTDTRHAWCYVNDESFNSSDGLQVNTAARERRRLLSNITDMSPTTKEFDRNLENGIYGSNETVTVNQVNCFTIFNKHMPFESDTSSDSGQCRNLRSEGNDDSINWNKECNFNDSQDDEVIVYDPDKENEKRMIWIYSLKNRCRLSDNDFELVNIPSKESDSSSYSLENVEDYTLTDRGSNTVRIATPIPPCAYTPKLNLTPPSLPTVTEVSEPVHTNTVEVETQSCFNQLNNNWFTDYKNTKYDKSTNIIQWMALSPREKRRKFRNIHTNTNKVILPMLDDNKSEEIGIVETESFNDKKVNTDITINIEIDTLGNGDSEQRPDPHEEFTKGLHDVEADIHEVGETGDHVSRKLKKPRIFCDPRKIFTHSEITDPIENLEGNWIACNESNEIVNELNEKKYSGMMFDQTVIIDNSASHRLFHKNMCLIRPSEWSSYLPIVDSVPSLSLTIEESSNDDAKWFKRLITCMCCRK